jgi:hypothetical protein
MSVINPNFEAAIARRSLAHLLQYVLDDDTPSGGRQWRPQLRHRGMLNARFGDFRLMGALLPCGPSSEQTVNHQRTNVN